MKIKTELSNRMILLTLVEGRVQMTLKRVSLLVH